MKENKGCVATIIVVSVFVVIGKLLFKAIESIGEYLAIILMTSLGIIFLGFVIMCIRGMEKEKGED